MKCPHCGKEIEQKVHLAGDNEFGPYTACTLWTYPSTKTTTDKSLVTCLNCKRSKAFKEAA